MKGYLVALKLRAPTGRKRDREAGRDTARRYGAQENAVHVDKDILSERFVKAIQKADNAIRTEFYRRTLSTGITSLGFLPANQKEEFENALNISMTQRDQTVHQMLSDYAEERDKAKSRLGSMFNEVDFPTREQLAAKYSARYCLMTLPSNNNDNYEDDDLGNFARDEILKEAYTDLCGRIVEMVKRVLDKLERIDGGKEVKETAFVAMRELTPMLESMLKDVWGGGTGASTALERVHSELWALDPRLLAEDGEARVHALKAAREIIAGLGGKVEITPEDKDESPDPVPPKPEKPSGYDALLD